MKRFIFIFVLLVLFSLSQEFAYATSIPQADLQNKANVRIQQQYKDHAYKSITYQYDEYDGSKGKYIMYYTIDYAPYYGLIWRVRSLSASSKFNALSNSWGDIQLNTTDDYQYLNDGIVDSTISDYSSGNFYAIIRSIDNDAKTITLSINASLEVGDHYIYVNDAYLVCSYYINTELDVQKVHEKINIYLGQYGGSDFTICLTKTGAGAFSGLWGTYSCHIEANGAGKPSRFIPLDWNIDEAAILSGNSSPSNYTYNNISGSQSNDSLYTTGYVIINCYDQNGVFINSFTETIYNDQYIYPPAINNYTARDNSYYIAFNNITGLCSPESVDFYYDRQTYQSIVYPYNWDTQFKPGTATKIDDTGTYSNGNMYTRLPNLSDNNASTTFWWLIWQSERTDNVPELTAYFNGETVGAIGIRNGNLRSSSTYYDYARVRRFKVRIYQTNGSMSETFITLPDQYTTEYQVLSLGQSFPNVSRIELWLDGGNGEGYYAGRSETYYIHIAEMQFYTS